MTEILGGPEVYIEGGSTINLTCVITGSPEPPSYIFWSHKDKVTIYGFGQHVRPASVGVVKC